MNGIIGGEIGYRILKTFGEKVSEGVPKAYIGVSKLDKLLGNQFWEEIENRIVIDFGCGNGEDAVEMAKRGAKRVIGIDIRNEVLNVARASAKRNCVESKCSFVNETNEKADIVTSIDAFEHFDNPSEVLRIMRSLIRDDGKVIAVFGPTWYHPLGGHLFSVFPFAHLIFTESALIRWRSDFKSDGAKKINEVSGGLNMMTISRFEKLIGESDFRFSRLDLVPIRRLRRIAGRWTREFTTSVVRCDLVPA
jgi:cyclopropane fatty-acyl-phospholipid synthase-like methyltransferase